MREVAALPVVDFLYFKRYQFDFSFNYSITNDAIEMIFPLFCRDNSMRSVMNED